MVTYKILTDLQQLFDQHGVPGAVDRLRIQAEILCAKRSTSHCATAACTYQTLMDASM